MSRRSLRLDDLEFLILSCDQGVIFHDEDLGLFRRAQNDVVVVLHLAEAGEHRRPEVTVPFNSIDRE